MRSALEEDRNTSAVIRDNAMELFTAHGTSAVTVRKFVEDPLAEMDGARADAARAR